MTLHTVNKQTSWRQEVPIVGCLSMDGVRNGWMGEWMDGGWSSQSAGKHISEATN